MSKGLQLVLILAVWVFSNKLVLGKQLPVLCVVTVSADINDSQHQATKNAGSIAGPDIEVTFDTDVNGIVSVSAVDKSTEQDHHH
ncbi:hypothetical protein P7K49_027434 [Saguinus oedipus]|uniref:Uncharacterized protein n=1 Tax=Saguinus oedipus TaxID=9490 RepID=A0ABQ9U9V7_SAGOE|nr:hypothetical protein P7K49_027434 [Saguinus oedipus]